MWKPSGAGQHFMEGVPWLLSDCWFGRQQMHTECAAACLVHAPSTDKWGAHSSSKQTG